MKIFIYKNEKKTKDLNFTVLSGTVRRREKHNRRYNVSDLG